MTDTPVQRTADERTCICSDPENCTERVPGYRCKKDFLPKETRHTVEPIYSANHGYAIKRPYIVKVNGKTLLDKALNPRRFKDSMSAAVAGAKAAKGEQ